MAQVTLKPLGGKFRRKTALNVRLSYVAVPVTQPEIARVSDLCRIWHAEDESYHSQTFEGMRPTIFGLPGLPN